MSGTKNTEKTLITASKLPVPIAEFFHVALAELHVEQTLLLSLLTCAVEQLVG